MPATFQIDIRSLPADGKHIEGKLPPAFFGLTEKDEVKPISPLEYCLDIENDDGDIIVTGSLAATFSLECGRCTERFEHRLALDEYLLETELENTQTMDLTDAIREDILLALPSHPRCEDGNVTPRACPAEGRFDHHESLPEAPADKGVWDALDKLKS